MYKYIVWREELVNDLIGQFVDVFIFMILKLFNFLQSCKKFMKWKMVINV